MASPSHRKWNFYLAADMTLKSILRYILITFLVLLGLIAIFLLFSIGPVDRTPAHELESYAVTMQRLDSVQNLPIPKPQNGFSVGFSKVNLTPDHKTATAGYGNRRGKLFSSIHDSIYVRAIVIDNGTQKAAIVSADLLIIPPLVTERLKEKLNTIGFTLDNTFLGATHTHNSIGNWAEGAAEFLYGDYDDAIVDFISDKIIEAIQQASTNTLPAILKTGVVSAPEEVSNRLIDQGPEDPLLRSIEIVRSDSSKLVLLSYNAHATCLYSRDMELSRDYPGVLVDNLEQSGYNFAMFIAGAVGSHKCSAPQMGWDCTEYIGDKLSEKFLLSKSQLSAVNDTTIATLRIPLSLSDPQIKIATDWKIHPWLFRAAFGEFPVYLNVLRVGDIVFLGTPCDFSGEFNGSLDSLAQSYQLKTFVTSFNGGYIGYVTPSRYYDVEHYETQLMNWYAPGTGEYVEECLEKLIVAVKR